MSRPCAPLLRVIDTPRARLPRRTPRPSRPLLSIRQDAYGFSDANKLLIRCAWTGGSAFADAGYDNTSWVNGTCPSKDKSSGGSGGGVGVVGPAVGGAAAFLLLAVGVGAVIWKRERFCSARRAAAGVAAKSES